MLSAGYLMALSLLLDRIKILEIEKSIECPISLSETMPLTDIRGIEQNNNKY